jgi:hypothetical protein
MTNSLGSGPTPTYRSIFASCGLCQSSELSIKAIKAVPHISEVPSFSLHRLTSVYYTAAWVFFMIFLVMGGLHIAKGALAISIVTTALSFVLIFVISALFALADWKAEEQ